jgi:hypothetical protein
MARDDAFPFSNGLKSILLAAPEPGRKDMTWSAAKESAEVRRR